jgi:hypothetical protein
VGLRYIAGAIGFAALGAAFGATASLLNDLSSPYGELGGHVADAGWTWLPELASVVVGRGWAWAALAVAAGWLAGTRGRGATAGVLALIWATTAYYCMDSVLRREPLDLYWAEMLRWWLAGLLFGALLGAVGATIRSIGLIGRRAR